MYTLIHFRLCPFSRAIRIALPELGIETSLREEAHWQARPEFLELNPAGELPVLERDDDMVFCGAYAIAEYLADAHTPLGLDALGRAEIELFPGNAESRAEVRRLVDWFSRKFDREVTRELMQEKVYGRLANPSGGHTPDVGVLRIVRANLRQHVRYVGHLMEARRWLAGEDMSFADIMAAAHLSVADYLGEVTWDEVPRAKVWYMRMKSRPSMRPLLTERLPGFPPADHYANLDF
jgi:glutathione S-transferase